jgi:hypothetical protein
LMLMSPRRNADAAPFADTIRDSGVDVAPQNSHRPDAVSQHKGTFGAVESLHWDDLRVVLAAARAGSFRKAGAAIGKDIATVVRRIRRIEAEIGEKLETSGKSPRLGMGQRRRCSVSFWASGGVLCVAAAPDSGLFRCLDVTRAHLACRASTIVSCCRRYWPA